MNLLVHRFDLEAQRLKQRRLRIRRRSVRVDRIDKRRMLLPEPRLDPSQKHLQRVCLVSDTFLLRTAGQESKQLWIEENDNDISRVVLGEDNMNDKGRSSRFSVLTAHNATQRQK